MMLDCCSVSRLLFPTLALFCLVGCSNDVAKPKVPLDSSDGNIQVDNFSPTGLWTATENRLVSLNRSQPDPSLTNTQSMRFTSLSPAESGVDFTNHVDITHPMKRLYESGFVCGGVVIGDVDGDELPDLFFTNGPGPNALFRQTGNLKFENTTDEASLSGPPLSGGSHWSAGAAMVDIDNDGDLDIYVCNYDSPNELFLNNGRGQFHESAATWGLDLVDACLMPAFCDYDRDGDLDVYVLTNRYYRAGGRPQRPPYAVRDGKPYIVPEYEKYYQLKHKGGNKYDVDNTGRPDHLLRNDGDGKFTDVSQATGITKSGHGLSVTWWDHNHDGWPDIYIGDDFNDPDHLYHNNGDGTFTDRLESAIPHTSWFSMGADFGDLNGDGRFDLLVADMSATTHYSQKTTMGAMSAAKLAEVAGPPPQIMKNALFLNSGTDRFLEVAELAGLADSDWTWAIKLADFDNDGSNDVFISNGMVRNFNNSDLSIKTEQLIGKTEWDLRENQATRPEQNLAYRNAGDLKFDNVSQAWGLDHVSMSYATAYSDLDRDGDLDLVVANLDEPVSIYRNDSNDGNRLLIALRGTRSNRYGVGATVTLQMSDRTQVRMLSPQTGFQSSNEPLIHFGLGDQTEIKTLTIDWPSGHRQIMENVSANQMLTIVESATDESITIDNQNLELAPPTLKSVVLGDPIIHRETEFDDFAHQPLLPNKLSQLGPGIAVADCDGDGDEDFYLGGAFNQPGQLMLNQGDGQYKSYSNAVFDNDRRYEDMGAVWLDVDADGDDDLYVVSGGVEAQAGSDFYRDRLYLNDGNGELTPAPEDWLPDLFDSGSSVCAADFDRDGDLDLFVGSRVIPHDYPTSPVSRLLKNDQGKFTDATSELAPTLLKAGLVTGAVWSDADNDGWPDLLLATEWGPIRLLHNAAGKLEDQTTESGLSEFTGWWNGIAGRDLDGDGDMDYVATNFGLNTKYHATTEKPVVLYYGDFEGTGVKQLVEAEYENDVLFPIRGKSCSTNAMPSLADKFDTYHQFALATVDQIYTPECLDDSQKFTINTLESVALINDGTGKFEVQPLPKLAQISPGFGVVLTELNNDGKADLIVAQNFFTPQAETGRMDSGMGLLLTGKGDGTFQTIMPDASGFIVTGDAKAVVESNITGGNRTGLLVSVNDGPLLAFERQPEVNQVSQSSSDNSSDGKRLGVELAGAAGNPHGVGALVTIRTSDGKSQTAEVAAGHGYLSQSSSTLSFGVPTGTKVEKIEIRWPDGTSSTHDANDDAVLLIEKPE